MKKSNPPAISPDSTARHPRLLRILIGTTYIRDATCIGFCVNELLSIIENTSLMGIPYPPAIKKAIEVLQKRAQHIDDDIQKMIDNMEDDKK